MTAEQDFKDALEAQRTLLHAEVDQKFDNVSGAFDVYTGGPPPPAGPDPYVGGLPGDLLGTGGAHRYLAGSGDSLKWLSTAGRPDTLTSAKIQQFLGELKLGIIREWFPKFKTGKSGPQNTPADFTALANVPFNAGAACLGVLYQWQDLAYMQQVVSTVGSKCNMYEFGNEPYGTDYTTTGNWLTNVNSYVDKYALYVPQLKAINPNALFMGPSSPQDLATFDAMLDRMIVMGVTPDAVTYHAYGETSEIISQVDQARVICEQHFGTGMPFGLTEWNKAVPNSNDTVMHDFVLATLEALIGHCDFACHFDIASQTPTVSHDIFTTASEATVTKKGAYNGLRDFIVNYNLED
jgi:hypothetical protein